MVHRALRRANKLHRKQERDGAAPLPYLTHPVDVLNLVRYVGRVTDEEVLAAALLHDVLEETEARYADIEEEFGPRVAGIVRELTRDEPEQGALSEQEFWELRTQMMLAEIDNMGREARTIKLADRISNLQGAFATKPKPNYDRYLLQSRMILKHIPYQTNRRLWLQLKLMVTMSK